MKKVCSLDVHKDNIFCAIYNGENYSEGKEFSTMTPDIYSMGEYLQLKGVEGVAYTVKHHDLLDCGLGFVVLDGVQTDTGQPLFHQADTWA